MAADYKAVTSPDSVYTSTTHCFIRGFAGMAVGVRTQDLRKISDAPTIHGARGISPASFFDRSVSDASVLRHTAAGGRLAAIPKESDQLKLMRKVLPRTSAIPEG
jgi:hypothetical protein